MRSEVSLFPVVTTACTAFALVVAIFVSPNFAHGAEATPGLRSGCSCPQGADPKASDPKSTGKPTKPKFAGLQTQFDAHDQIAALESVQFALSQVADGSSYVWHRSHGRLSGIVKPTASFKDHRGQVCRHVVVILNGLEETKKTEAIACRLTSGVWELDG